MKKWIEDNGGTLGEKFKFRRLGLNYYILDRIENEKHEKEGYFYVNALIKEDWIKDIIENDSIEENDGYSLFYSSNNEGLKEMFNEVYSILGLNFILAGIFLSAKNENIEEDINSSSGDSYLTIMSYETEFESIRISIAPSESIIREGCYIKGYIGVLGSKDPLSLNNNNKIELLKSKLSRNHV